MYHHCRLSDDDVIWVPKDKDLRDALVRNGTIPENRKVDAWLDGNSAGHHGGGVVFPPIRLSNDIEIVFETPVRYVLHMCDGILDQDCRVTSVLILEAKMLRSSLCR